MAYQRYTEEQKQQVTQLKENGNSVTEISKLTGVPKGSVYHLISTTPKPDGTGQTVTIERRQEAIKQAANNVKRRRIKGRKSPRYITEAQYEEIRAKAAKGWSSTRLARRFNLSTTSIWRYVNGVKPTEFKDAKATKPTPKTTVVKDDLGRILADLVWSKIQDRINDEVKGAIRNALKAL